MPFIIDGHNLVPYLPGISLADLDDENALVSILQDFARIKRSRIEVFFDQAPLTLAGKKTYGQVVAHYVRTGSTADQAIKRRLAELAGEARNWIVVSSDREVQAEARSYHSRTITSAEFSGMLLDAKKDAGEESEDPDQPEVPDEDIDYWLEQFGGD